MAGFVAEAQALAGLADEWNKALRAKHPGRIGYFKMDEAVGLTGEFRHCWTRTRIGASLLRGRL
jgi:hypothetical protein